MSEGLVEQTGTRMRRKPSHMLTINNSFVRIFKLKKNLLPVHAYNILTFRLSIGVVLNLG